jgi:hypothetical protein
LANYLTSAQEDSWSRQIISVNVNTNTITFFPKLAVAPGIGDNIEFLPYSYDNNQPAQIYAQPNTVPYYARLESLMIPNTPIWNANLRSIPYLHIELNNAQSSYSNKHLVNSNNPNTQDSVWIVRLDPKVSDSKYLRFIAVDTKQDQQKLMLNVSEPLILTIKIPGTGEIFRPIQDDTRMPQSSWPELNIYALFDFQNDDNSIKRYL